MKKKLALLALSAILLSVPTLSVVDANDTQQSLAQEQGQFKSVTDEVYTNSLSAASLTATRYSIGKVVSVEDINKNSREHKSSKNVIFNELSGGEVFVSNAPEHISKPSQINATLYRDTVTGDFRFWSHHINKRADNITFYMYVKNPNTDPVKLYIKRKGYGVNLDNGNPALAGNQAVKQFLDSPIQGQLLATIPAGGSYVYRYSSISKSTMSFIGDFRAVNTRTGVNADVKISDIVTNNGDSNLDKYANTPTIAPTNYDDGTADDYRGILPNSTKKGSVTITLDSSTPAKWIALGDAPIQAYKGEQESLYSRWTTEGKPQNKTAVISKTKTGPKEQGGYWGIDYKLDINIINNTKSPKVYTLLGTSREPINGAGAYLNYTFNSSGASKSVHVNGDQAIVLSDKNTLHVETNLAPGVNGPLGLYFSSGQ